jgi:hypothetical protein
LSSETGWETDWDWETGWDWETDWEWETGWETGWDWETDWETGCCCPADFFLGLIFFTIYFSF